jgi:hypothetical protein
MIGPSAPLARAPRLTNRYGRRTGVCALILNRVASSLAQVAQGNLPAIGLQPAGPHHSLKNHRLRCALPSVRRVA